jgi:hypothetical protein
VATSKIQDSLFQNPEAEQTLFAERARFDLIVYYDQSSKTVEAAHGPATNIRKALESQQLRRPPMMLVGGFDAWQSTIGDRGVYKFPVQHKEKKYWFKSNTNGTSEHEHHNTLYDYVSNFFFYVNYIFNDDT